MGGNSQNFQGYSSHVARTASILGVWKGSSSVPMVLWMIPQEKAPDEAPNPSPT